MVVHGIVELAGGGEGCEWETPETRSGGTEGRIVIRA